ncbi:F-box containing protein [Marseillevirus marseillevirus]|uniref:F-box containing protein n=1 Tax=Marseillevirus marseillevirus TaxID=694581 RepID=D2XB21_GBMV|nr:F-box containing protein [Marseillevirus marseillevirus]ADB04148.1 F-box containing protein [Marseillevirus marseillevirus]
MQGRILKMELESLPVEIWCHVFSFLGSGNDLLKLRTLCREVRDIVDENLKKRVKKVVDGFERRCGGKHPKKAKTGGCIRLMFLGDFRKKKPVLSRYPHPLPPIQEEPPLPECKDCQIPQKQRSPLVFHLPCLDEEMPFETFLRIMREFTERICVPGRYTKEADISAFKADVERFLVRRFGLRWTERNKKAILDGCDWSNKNKQLMNILRK